MNSESSIPTDSHSSLDELVSYIERHINNGECSSEEIKIARDAFNACLWSEESNQKIREAVEFF